MLTLFSVFADWSQYWEGQVQELEIGTGAGNRYRSWRQVQVQELEISDVVVTEIKGEASAAADARCRWGINCMESSEQQMLDVGEALIAWSQHGWRLLNVQAVGRTVYTGSQFNCFIGKQFCAGFPSPYTGTLLTRARPIAHRLCQLHVYLHI